MDAVNGRPMRIGIFLPVGGKNMMGGKDARWADLLAMARLAEETGFDFVAGLDHLDDFWEGWSLLAALAASTSTIGLLSYVTCTTYRNPALLAKIADTVDEISGGRLILGLGAGDSPSEHYRYGYPRDRPVARFEEALTIIRTLLREGRFDFKGEFYEVRECELRPRGPRPEGPPILIGSLGGKRMQRLTAQHADIWACSLPLTLNTLEGADAPLAAMDAMCRKHGRDPETLEKMIELVVQYPGGMADQWEGSESWENPEPLELITGDAEEVAETLHAFHRKGFSSANIWVEPCNLEGIEQLARALEAFDRATNSV